MSLGELLVVMLIALLVMKPSDLPIVIGKIRDLTKLLSKFKQEIFDYFKDQKVVDIESELDEINFYLERIIKIEGKYDGIYELDSIRKKYLELTKNSLLK